MLIDMKDLFFEDIKKQIDTKFIDEGWIIVFYSFKRDAHDFSSGNVYTAIIDADKEQDENYDQKIISAGTADTRRGFEYEPKYCRFSNEGFEPLIYRRGGFGQKDGYLELSEEFRLYHNLYEEYHSPDKKEYLYFDDNGDEEIVAKIDNNQVCIKLNFLKDYISARGKHFLIYFNFIRFSEKTMTELGINNINKNNSSDDYFYNHEITDISNLSVKTRSWIKGKVLIKKIENYRTNTEKNDKFEEFIIGCNENGDNLSFSCNEKKLGNYFGKNPKAPQYTTPVFFKEDVLQKYYNNPNKYSVDDGRISCNKAWSLRVDNNCNDYVIVLLGDLGNLHHKEQLYWKSFNIPPSKEGLSDTGFKRFFAGEFCDPVKADLELKMKLEQFNELWFKKYTWHLFKPLSKDDSHYLKALHLLTSQDNQAEFNEQILALTKIFIDSLNEKELVKEIIEKKSKGIDKFESFLKHNNVMIPKDIELLRYLQNLRSSTVAHRRSENLNEKILSYFEFDKKKKLNEILRDIFIKLIHMMDTLLRKFKML